MPERGIDEPLSAPDLFSKKLKRFQEELYNLHQDSHLTGSSWLSVGRQERARSRRRFSIPSSSLPWQPLTSMISTDSMEIH